jgi:hypothetical protein
MTRPRCWVWMGSTWYRVRNWAHGTRGWIQYDLKEGDTVTTGLAAPDHWWLGSQKPDHDPRKGPPVTT